MKKVSFLKRFYIKTAKEQKIEFESATNGSVTVSFELKEIGQDVWVEAEDGTISIPDDGIYGDIRVEKGKIVEISDNFECGEKKDEKMELQLPAEVVKILETIISKLDGQNETIETMKKEFSESKDFIEKMKKSTAKMEKDTPPILGEEKNTIIDEFYKKLGIQ